jgi:hypothetical protein
MGHCNRYVSGTILPTVTSYSELIHPTVADAFALGAVAAVEQWYASSLTYDRLCSLSNLSVEGLVSPIAGAVWMQRARAPWVYLSPINLSTNMWPASPVKASRPKR